MTLYIKGRVPSNSSDWLRAPFSIVNFLTPPAPPVTVHSSRLWSVGEPPMKRCLLFGLSMVLLTHCGLGWGAATVDPGISSEYKSEADPTPHKADIVGKITAEVARLANDADAPGQ